jgi:hypothetical protein
MFKEQGPEHRPQPSLAVQSLALQAGRMLEQLEKSVHLLMELLQKHPIEMIDALSMGKNFLQVMPMEISENGNGLWGTITQMSWMVDDFPEFSVVLTTHSGGAQVWHAEVDGVPVASRQVSELDIQTYTRQGVDAKWEIDPLVLGSCAKGNNSAALDILLRHIAFAQEAHTHSMKVFEERLHVRGLQIGNVIKGNPSFSSELVEEDCEQANDALKKFRLSGAKGESRKVKKSH